MRLAVIAVGMSGAMREGLADPDRFRAFYADALPHVYGYFLARGGGDVATAEDLTQETFLAAVTQIKRGAAIAAPVPWILGIARHKLLDHFRRQRRVGWAIVSLEDEIEQDGDRFAALVDDPAAPERAMAALAGVPLTQREALILHYLDGLSVAEVADLLERSVSATESLLARGRVSFRQHFGEAGDDA